MAKSINERIEAAKLEKEQAEARIKELLQQQKAQERKDRNHRLCKRGGLVEKMKVVRYSKYFPIGYSQRQMDEVIIELLRVWKTQQSQ